MNRREMDELLHKSRRSLAAAERLLRDGDHDFAVSKAYFAMFYAAQALLLTRDIRRSKHSGIIAAFNEQFVREGKGFTPTFHFLERRVRRSCRGRLWAGGDFRRTSLRRNRRGTGVRRRGIAGYCWHTGRIVRCGFTREELCLGDGKDIYSIVTPDVTPS